MGHPVLHFSSPDVRVVSVLVGLVGDDLHPAVRQRHPVLARGLVAVPRLLVGEVVPGVAVLHRVPERVVGGLLSPQGGKERKGKKNACTTTQIRQVLFSTSPT